MSASPLPKSPSSDHAALPPSVEKRATTVDIEATSPPPDDALLRLYSLHLLLFDIRLTALSARLANDRALQALLYLVPPHILTDLFSQVLIAREQDVAASPRSILSTEDAASAAFRSARRALKIEFRLNEILAAYHPSVSRDQLGLSEDEDPNAGPSLPQPTLESLDSILYTSGAHRRAHSKALARALRSWAEADDSTSLRANIEALQARLAVLTSDTTPMATTKSASNSPTSQHQLHTHDANIDTNPFDPPTFAGATGPLFKSYSSSSLKPSAQTAHDRSLGAMHDSAAGNSHAARSTASLSAAAGYDASHPYGAPWPPSPHYYYLPPYGHPHGAFPPLYDSTPLHFPLTDRLLRDTPSRVAGFYPGSSSASNPSLRPHVTSPSAFEVESPGPVPGRNAVAVRPTNMHLQKTAPRVRRSQTVVESEGPYEDEEIQTGLNGRPAGTRRKKMGKGGKKMASRLAYFAQSEGAGMIASAIVRNAPVPKNVRKWHSIGRVVNDWYGFEENGPSKAELLSKGVGLMLKNSRRRHSFHAGSRSVDEDSDSEEEGNTIGRIASHAIGMVAGGNKGKKGNAWGNMASSAIHTFNQGNKSRKKQLRRRNSWNNGNDGHYDRNGGAHDMHFEDARQGRGGGRSEYYADERRDMGHSRRGRRNAYSDDEDGGLEGMVTNAVQALMSTKKRTGRGRSGGMIGQIGDLVGRGGYDRRSRGGGGPADAFEMAFKVLNKLR